MPVLQCGPVDATRRPLPAPTGRANPPPSSLQRLGDPVRSWALRTLRHVVAREHRRLVLPLVAMSVVSTVSTLGAPWLERWPLLLAVLAPRAPFLVLAAASTPLPLFVALGTIRLCAADPFHYLLGRRLLRVPARGHLAPRIEGWIERWGTAGCFVAIVVRPIGRHLFVAGATRANPIAVAVVDVLSTVAFVLALHLGAGAL
jgi:hypothetical protein